MQMKPFIIRSASAADSAKLRDAFNRSRAAAGCFQGGDITSEEFAAQIEGEEIHVATRDDLVLGFASVWRPERFIHHLYVLPEYQGQGIGSALLQHCQQHYGRPLSLKCTTTNSAALCFYRNQGWIRMEDGVGENGPWQLLRLPA